MRKYVPVTQDKRKRYSEQEIQDIRAASAGGESNRSIARRLNLSESYVWRITNGMARKK